MNSHKNDEINKKFISDDKFLKNNCFTDSLDTENIIKLLKDKPYLLNQPQDKFGLTILYRAVVNKNYNLCEASKKLKINYFTARTIVKIFKHEKRIKKIGKKKNNLKKSNIIESKLIKLYIEYLYTNSDLIKIKKETDLLEKRYKEVLLQKEKSINECNDTIKSLKIKLSQYKYLFNTIIDETPIKMKEFLVI